MHWIRVRELVRKEFIQLFRDRRTRSLLIVAPVIQLLVFGYVVSTEVRDIRVGFLDQARTVESRKVFDGFDANRTFRITHIVDQEKELELLLLQRAVDITVQIPSRFAEQIKQSSPAELQIIADGSASNMAAVRIAYAMTVLDKINQHLIEERIARPLQYGRIDDRTRTWYNPNLDSRDYFIPGVVAFLIMLTTLLFTSMAIVRERR